MIPPLTFQGPSQGHVPEVMKDHERIDCDDCDDDYDDDDDDDD